ncbi:MAG TPA: MBOAT family protein [Phycisphaerae bacterium]|nr:MBOAT family protein [Phycisphaerae bacterium]HRW52639.1 MBOAT family protein [Phycisphaerae bacterium]
MIFNSLTFLVFFGIVLCLHMAPLSWRAKKLNLLVASYIFYAAWNPPFVALIWLSTLVDWFAAKWMNASDNPNRRRALMLVSLVTNLGLLGYFKYGGFLLENFVELLRMSGVSYRPPTSNIVLPVGISFYTFQTLSYTIDVYRRNLQPCKSFLDFALFVTFFPQLVAGPIVRASDFLPQCAEPRQANPRQLGWGFCLLAVGLFEKVVLADGILAPVADQVYDNATGVGFVDAWLGTIAFSGQIFCDFAGYSTCAIGAAMCLGFVLPDNFRFPYAAMGFSDFWRRWHISLSTWLRDYLYIPLGGNRHGRVRTNVNLMATMLIGGLWHGASWRFVVWGGLHGLYLVAERVARHFWSDAQWAQRRYGRVFLAALTYLLVCVTWVFFRAPDFGAAWEVVTAMFTRPPGFPTQPFAIGSVGLVTACLLIGQWMLRDSSIEATADKLPSWARSLVLIAILVSLALVQEDDRAFIYFQF